MVHWLQRTQTGRRTEQPVRIETKTHEQWVVGGCEWTPQRQLMNLQATWACTYHSSANDTRPPDQRVVTPRQMMNLQARGARTCHGSANDTCPPEIRRANCCRDNQSNKESQAHTSREWARRTKKRSAPHPSQQPVICLCKATSDNLR